MFALLCIWFLISFPLVWVGVWLGYRKALKDPPVKTNMVPRVIPVPVWYLHQLFTMVIGGILPFGAVFIELYFIMSSIWLQRFYYVFGFLALARPARRCPEPVPVLCPVWSRLGAVARALTAALPSPSPFYHSHLV